MNMKGKRFITEYGNYRKRELLDELLDNKSISHDEIVEKLDGINKYISMCSRGLITVSECVIGIANI